MAQLFSCSGGVTQLSPDVCYDGKYVVGGIQQYDSIDDSPLLDNVCCCGWWTQDPCQRNHQNSTIAYNISVHQIALATNFFPLDVSTFTNSRTLDPHDKTSGLGVATGFGYGNTPFTIRYDDVAPVLQEDHGPDMEDPALPRGLWRFHRHTC